MFTAQLLRRASPVAAVARRAMSSGADHAASIGLWKNASFAGIAVVGVFGAYTVYPHLVHHHESPEKKVPYAQNRAKPFPWGKDSLFADKH